MSNSLTTRMLVGFPGRITREDSKTVEPVMVDSGTPPTAYGTFAKFVAGLLQPVAASDAGTVPVGLLASPFPIQSSTNTMGAATPPAAGVVDLMKRGYMAVALKLGAAVRGSQVYVVTTAGGSVAVGDIVTSASPAGGGAAVAVTNCVFMGPADANGVTEIAYNI